MTTLVRVDQSYIIYKYMSFISFKLYIYIHSSFLQTF